ncbi:hypothetical protein HZU73_09235 [Apis mellifera caucasica]|uniref:Uncharacterized protein LOC102655636 n=1 Tax=Apis mellifera TaxID=7460 RepID=A0A7M7GZH6_APIME|nr:uncharacterized protein LOC102655636 [Apis mellifera]KAG6795452.1 hypothetical protein HZU73_09235 [Apis mellifera caucasica]KAG9438207.1 hypothetical protein HZU67_01217 [Apis mellifera carnica]|eukprot:XP_006571524.1 uncharacterized protein LOC102655636 [Apis mellifera]
MKIKLLSQLILILTALLVTVSQGFLFGFPRNVLRDFLQLLKERKEVRKQVKENLYIDHYHIYYYPIEYSIFEPPLKAPKKYELEEIHNNHLATLGWSNHEYKYVPESKIFSNLYDS